jgi:glycosyltransferase involved in cell wall biosynthesis
MPTPVRILFLVQPGTNSRSIFLDMIRGFADAGHQPVLMELGEVWDQFGATQTTRIRAMTEATRRLRGVVRDQGIHAAVGMWANALATFVSGMHDGRAVSVFDLIGLPHVLYWLDAPQWAQDNWYHQHFGQSWLSGPSSLHIVNNSATAAEMSRVLRMGRCAGLPYGINPEVFRPATNVAPTFDVVMNVGPGDPSPTEAMLRELENDEPDLDSIRRQIVRERVMPELDACVDAMSGSGDRDGIAGVLHELAQTQLSAAHTPMLDRLRSLGNAQPSMGNAIQRLLASPAVYVRAGAAIRATHSFERAFTACWLAKRFSVAVFGKFSPAWPFRGQSLGEVEYADIPKAYQRGRLAVNVMRWQDDAGLNLKPLEITASGVACLCGKRTGMDAMFEVGREILAFDSPSDAGRRVRELLGDESARRELAEAGRARTLVSHTWARRAGQMLDLVQAVPRMPLEQPPAAREVA